MLDPAATFRVRATYHRAGPLPSRWREGRRFIERANNFLPIPPSGIIENSSLFLDLDGTLLELAERPEDVSADASVRELLKSIAAKLEGRLAVISGRSIEQIDTMLGEVAERLSVSGSHGCEHRWQGVWARPNRPPSLDEAAKRLHPLAEEAGLVLEEKSFGVAVHYRLNPAAEADAHALAGTLASELELVLQHGKMMVELRVGGGDKGRAVERLMSRPPMSGTTPIFVGDDVTDEPGFAAARALGGYAILIGQPRSSAANYNLATPADLRNWLTAAAV